MTYTDDLIGENMRRLRNQQQMTQDFLGVVMGWSRTTVAQAEIGRRRFRVDDLIELCNAFGCSYRELLRGDQNAIDRLDPAVAQIRKELTDATQ